MSSTQSPPLYPVIVGPTAGGKSALALNLAQQLQTPTNTPELISADAYQIYKHLNIGTAKPTPQELALFKHHLIDIIEPGQRFTVADWLNLTNPIIQNLQSNNQTPIVVGGTNLYIQSFLEGMFTAPEPTQDILDKVESMPQPDRRTLLQQVDPDAHDRIDPNDLRRTKRALAVYLQTNTPITTLQQQWNSQSHSRPNTLLVGLLWEPKDINPRINARVKQMIEQGLVEEAHTLYTQNKLTGQAAQTIGYKQLIPHFQNKTTLNDAIERIKIDTRRFAKNQRTWLKRFRARPQPSLWLNPATTPLQDMTTKVLEALSPPQ